jgi:REP element-mobilizing transposase RayT
VPQSLANILTHLIFSTKNREPLLTDKDLRQRAHAYLAAVLKDLRCPALIVGGVADHVHILCQLAKTQSVSVVMGHLKASSSKWLKTQGVRTFSWQRGYGAFSVSQSNVASVVSYIEQQEEHHRTVTFEEEFRLFLKRYRVGFDERYVWD